MTVTGADKPAANVDEESRPAQSATPGADKRIWRYAALGVLLLLLLVLAAWWFRPAPLNGILIQSPQVADDFALMSSTGETMSLSDFRGQYVLLYFGYTFCPDVCPTTLNDLVDMADTLGERNMEGVQVILVSVDPERDTPEQLASYLRYFRPDFLGMTGSLAEIDAVASQFGVFFQRHEGSAATGYLVDHTSTITLVDPNGYVRMVFPYDTSGEEIAADLRYLMQRD